MLSRKEKKRILKMSRGQNNISKIARKTDHDRKTVRKYLKNPQPDRPERTWRTRTNPFEEVWDEIKELVRINPGLEAKTVFEYLDDKYPGKFSSGQLRTLQRHLKVLKAQEGPAREVTFPQKHYPGQLGSCDFTSMNDLDISIGGKKFKHLLFHFVLTYSNWEWARICFSESLESLRNGLQDALSRLGGVPQELLTDNLTAAVQNLGPKSSREFQRRYREMIDHFGLKARATQPSSPNENGDIEQRHYRLKKTVDQALMLRGSRDFETQDDYRRFLEKIIYKLNRGKDQKLEEELKQLKDLPETALATYSLIRCRVSRLSTIRVKNNSYSVPSRLIGETVEARVYDTSLEVRYAGKKVLDCEKLRGNNQSAINYRHIIESLLRKPGAFKKCRYKEQLFPTTTFRIAYDTLCETSPLQAEKIYLKLLHLAAASGQDSVERALKALFHKGVPLTKEAVERKMWENASFSIEASVKVDLPDLREYDEVFGLKEGAYDY